MGSNDMGQLGVNDESLQMSSAPLLVENFPEGCKALLIKCGNEHTAIISAFEDNTKMFTWGSS